MPIWTFKEIENAPPPAPSPTAEASLRAAMTLVRLDEASRRGIRISRRGLSFYRSVAEGEDERERYALARLRGAGVDEVEGSPSLAGAPFVDRSGGTP